MERFELLTKLFPEGELQPGQSREVTIEGISVLVLRRQNGEYRALRNRCSHQGSSLVGGRVEPLIDGCGLGEYRASKDREVIFCPTHEWEYDVDTGLSPADPRRVRVRAYPVTVTDGIVYLDR